MFRFSRLHTVVLAICLAGCASKGKDKTGLWRKIMRSGDELYTARAELGELDKSIQWYLSGVREFPDQATMMGRLSRAYVARAYGHPDDGLDGYSTAREFGLRCLMVNPSFNGLVQSAGGTVTRRAVETVEKDMVECLTWTSLAWSRWLDNRGVIGASIDLSAVKALAKRAVEVDPEFDGGRPHAALGLALALAPKPLKPKLKGARKHFNSAIEISPDRLTYQVDLAQYVSAAQGNQDEWVSILSRVRDTVPSPDDPDALENAQAVARAQALLGAGIDTRWDGD